MGTGAIPAGVLDRVRRHLVRLNMPRALETLDATLRGLEQGELSILEALEHLLGEELTMRETRRIKMALITARLGALKTLAGFDFAFQPSLDRNRVLALADIVASLLKAEREGQLKERIRFIARNALLIIDEIGYHPVTPGGANLFFQLVNARYERGAMILTSNRGFGEWGEIFADQVVATALLDRLLHHAVVIQIEGSSYRLREHAALVPENLRARSMTTPAAEQPRRRGRPKKEALAA